MAPEGAPSLRLTIHRRRERKLREAKIADAIKRGRLRCEVPGCQFDFERTYGTLGRGYAQVHHILPLADRGEDTPTALADLAVVCANCHVMNHRDGESRQIDRLITNTHEYGVVTTRRDASCVTRRRTKILQPTAASGEPLRPGNYTYEVFRTSLRNRLFTPMTIPVSRQGKSRG